MKLQGIVTSARIAVALIWRRLRGRVRGAVRSDALLGAGLLVTAIAIARWSLTTVILLLITFSIVSTIFLQASRLRRRGRSLTNLGLSTHRNLTPEENEAITRMSQERMLRHDYADDDGKDGQS